MIGSGQIWRQKILSGEDFDSTFVLVAMSHPSLLTNEYSKLQSLEDLCDGVMAAIVLGCVMNLLELRQLTLTDGVFLLAVLSFGLMQPYAVGVALRAFDRKLLLYRRVAGLDRGTKEVDG